MEVFLSVISLESIYGYVTDGFFNSQEEIDNYAKQPRTANLVI